MYSLCQIVDNKKLPLGSIDLPEVILGRDPREGGVKVGTESVSREHARFFKANDTIFFQDLGSTNGSWHNGVKCSEGEIKLVSIGDNILLADSRLIITDLDGSIADEEEKESGVWIFKGQNCKGFKSSADSQELVTIGGINSDFDFDEEQFSLPSLVVESRNKRLIAFQRSLEMPAKVGQAELEGEFELFHNDNIVISDYRVVCVSHKDQRPESNPVFTEIKDPNVRDGTALKTWDHNMDEEDTKLLADKSKPSGGIFGRIDDEDADLEQEFEESVDIDTVQSAAYRKFEQRLVLMVLAVLIGAIFIIAFWWLFTRG